MIINRIKRLKLVSNLMTLRNFLHRMDMRLYYLLLPVCLSLGTAFFEFVSTVLLIPLLKGITKGNFYFLKETRFFDIILSYTSKIFVLSNATIFVILISTVFIASFLKNALNYLAAVIMSYQVRCLSHNMRRKLFERYLCFGKLYYDRASYGYINSLLIGYTGTIAQRLLSLDTLLTNFLMLAAYAILMFAISWKLTIFVITASPIFYYSLRWLVKKTATSSAVYRQSYNALGKKMFDIFSCIPLVKTYANEDMERSEFNDLSEKLKRIEFSIDKKTQLADPLQQTILLIVLLVLISVVALMIIKGKQEAVIFIVYFYIVRRTIAAFIGINNIRIYMVAAKAPILEVLKIFDDKDKFFVKEGEKEFRGLQKDIRLNHLNFSYIDQKVVLKDITFNIEKGKITALIGPTGAGKTTLANLILRLYECPPSTIFMDGADIREFTFKSLRSHMALVSQEIFLFNDSLRSNIIYGLRRKISEGEIIDIAKKARLYDFIMSLPDKFDTLIGDRGVKLSGGEKQRLSIARAMIKGAEILILDEATSSLDSQTEHLIQEAINEAIRGRTTIVIAHRLSTIRNADKIVVIEDGRLIEQGPLHELLEKKGKFYEYWEAQKFY